MGIAKWEPDPEFRLSDWPEGVKGGVKQVGKVRTMKELIASAKKTQDLVGKVFEKEQPAAEEA